MEEVPQILRRHLEAVKERITAAMESYDRNASHRSVASLRVEVPDDWSGALWGSSSFLAMQRGRAPGKVPYKFPDIIRQWILDKGIAVTPVPAKRANVKYTPEERGLRSMAGAIAYSIMKRGTRLHRDNGYNDIFDTAVREELEALGREVLGYTAETLAQINDNA